ncbi:PREDICTED: uncharacterized protein LOC109306588 isoform X1 [Crocodylus porosus]|uniref:uncharacterized protein LOC109306588 isoform X1 n=1 Tax=Crocodylus porosus TaxID=8502 RepID=UPI00093BCDF9|nr:PREDICTED: uncharacterized protein LOC109306588 isoform X1 [Crocodylus porosus]
MGEVGGERDPEHLRLELGQEERMTEMLELSIFELKNTVMELEKQLGSVEDEGNEWKTRYETQVELNGQLERQIGLLQEKMNHIHGNPTDRLSSIRFFDQMPVVRIYSTTLVLRLGGSIFNQASTEQQRGPLQLFGLLLVLLLRQFCAVSFLLAVCPPVFSELGFLAASILGLFPFIIKYTCCFENLKWIPMKFYLCVSQSSPKVNKPLRDLIRFKYRFLLLAS